MGVDTHAPCHPVCAALLRAFSFYVQYTRRVNTQVLIPVPVPVPVAFSRCRVRFMASERTSLCQFVCIERTLTVLKNSGLAFTADIAGVQALQTLISNKEAMHKAGAELWLVDVLQAPMFQVALATTLLGSPIEDEDGGGYASA